MICAMGKIRILPRFDSQGNVHPQNTMNISWSADHRVLEGAKVAEFSVMWKGLIESPNSMLLNLR